MIVRLFVAALAGALSAVPLAALAQSAPVATAALVLAIRDLAGHPASR